MLNWALAHFMLFLYLLIMGLALAVFVIPFVVYPFLVERRLRRAGISVPAVCTGASWSEGRVSEYFKFKTLDGYRASYKSPLADGRISSDGAEVLIIYDPKAPHGRARTEMELFGGRSQLRGDVRFGILLMVTLHVMLLPFIVLFSL
ncbi:hypothetical protein GCM10010388_72770 [Streptomyces mauvecolor]